MIRFVRGLLSSRAEMPIESGGRGGGVEGGGEKLLLFRTLAVRQSGAGQPRVRSGKQTVAKGKAITMLVMPVIKGRI